MLAKRFSSLAVLLVMICASPAHVLGQVIPTSPPNKPNNVVYEGDLAALLAHLASTFNVNIGFETDPLEPKPKVKINAGFATVEDVLDAIVQAAPNYEWRNQDGFIDVHPREASCLLLDTAVSDFQVVSSDWMVASEALTSLPEVRRQMEATHLRRLDLAGTSRVTDLNPFSLKLENVTLRRALHEITKKSGKTFWMFQRYGIKSQLFSIRPTV